MAENINNEEQPIIVKKIIKKAGHGGGHGGAWKVAYADFVTAMMCLFLILWLINVDPSSKAAVASFFKQPTQTGPMQGNMFIFGGAKKPADPGKFEGGSSFLEYAKQVLSEANKKDINEQMKKELQKELELSADEDLLEKVEFNLVDKGILIEIKDSTKVETFESGSATLTEQAKTIIDKLSLILRKRNSPIIVAGHTDGKEFGYGNYDNWNLSTDRAIAVKTRMTFAGLEKSRFARVEGYADSQPKNEESPGAPENRRITLLLLQEGEIDNLMPEYLNEEEELGKEIMSEKSEEAEHKKAGEFDASKYASTGSRDTRPLSLEEIKRKKAREAFRKANPTPAPAEGGGGHGAPAPKPSGGGGH